MSTTQIIILAVVVLLGGIFVTPLLSQKPLVRIGAAMGYAVVGLLVGKAVSALPQSRPAIVALSEEGSRLKTELENTLDKSPEIQIIQAIKRNFPEDYDGIFEHVARARMARKSASASSLFMDRTGEVLNQILEREEPALKRANPAVVDIFIDKKVAELVALRAASPLACVRRALKEKIGDLRTNATEDKAIDASLIAYLDALGSARGRTNEVAEPGKQAGQLLAEALKMHLPSAPDFKAISRGSRIAPSEAPAQCDRFIALWRALAAIPQPHRQGLVAHDFVRALL